MLHYIRTDNTHLGGVWKEADRGGSLSFKSNPAVRWEEKVINQWRCSIGMVLCVAGDYRPLHPQTHVINSNAFLSPELENKNLKKTLHRFLLAKTLVSLLLFSPWRSYAGKAPFIHRRLLFPTSFPFYPPLYLPSPSLSPPMIKKFSPISSLVPTPLLLSLTYPAAVRTVGKLPPWKSVSITLRSLTAIVSCAIDDTGRDGIRHPIGNLFMK